MKTKNTTNSISIEKMIEKFELRYHNFKAKKGNYGLGDSGVSVECIKIPITATNNAGVVLFDRTGRKDFYMGDAFNTQKKFWFFLMEAGWKVEAIINNEVVIILPES